MTHPLNLMGAQRAHNLMGAWNSIVGFQNSGQPTNLQHGVYGGHRARGWHPNFGGFGGPGFGARHGGHWSHSPYGGYGYGEEQLAVQDYGPPPGYYGAPSGYPQHMHPAHAPGPHGWGGFSPSTWSPYAIPPRNQLVEMPAPSQANRILLPMSSGVAILPNTTAQVTSRSQTVAFRPERLVIGGTPGNWLIGDIKVGNRSQFAQGGDIPGELFANTTVDSFVTFETVQTAMDFVIVVTFTGASESGEPFVCGVLGTAAI